MLDLTFTVLPLVSIALALPLNSPLLAEYDYVRRLWGRLLTK